MRCADVTQEISAPSGRFEQVEIQRHAAECPSCSAFARASADLDRVWAATRPVEPSAAAFDAVWASANAALETPVSIPISSGRLGRRVFWVAAVLSNAAAVLLLLWTLKPKSDSNQAPAGPESVALSLLPIEQDVTCVIRINDNGVEVDRIDMEAKGPIMALNADVARSNDTDALNSFESMAE